MSVYVRKLQQGAQQKSRGKNSESKQGKPELSTWWNAVWKRKMTCEVYLSTGWEAGRCDGDGSFQSSRTQRELLSSVNLVSVKRMATTVLRSCRRTWVVLCHAWQSGEKTVHHLGQKLYTSSTDALLALAKLSNDNFLLSVQQFFQWWCCDLWCDESIDSDTRVVESPNGRCSGDSCVCSITQITWRERENVTWTFR